MLFLQHSRRGRVALAATVGLAAAAALGATAQATTPTVTKGAPQAAAALPSGIAAPYLYLGWGTPPSATSVMSATGIKQFTMAFMLSDGGCNPKWDGNRGLTGGTDQSTINAIRGAGGDVTVSRSAAGAATSSKKSAPRPPHWPAPTRRRSPPTS
ncbi:hypothetical protein [Streptomyces sp. SPB162]|uniref:hypothetical protein n=1 Tax=Streptomyces sp. SPB162 TaxID=2940560 RepID=UPI0024070758|nr:hypothetical protein [Streptomyces sp. SPB162]MDF9815765.1 hypothetical protein [Streptomyces sp. SPB162]